MRTYTKLQEGRRRLAAFLEPILAEMGRAERRRWGAFYVQGLLLEGGRKTAAGMAERYGGDEQALQQFVSQSPWDWRAVRRALTQATLPHLSTRCGWIVDETSFPKKGDRSVGVARQYAGTLGKVANCQIGVSLHYATDEACVPLDFALYLPEVWAHDEARRRAARVPADVRFTPKWQLALALIDQARAWEVPQGVVVADAGFGVVSEFRLGLRQRSLYYVVGVQASTGVWLEPVRDVSPPYRGRGRPRTRRDDLPKPRSVREVAAAWPREQWQEVTWRQGSKGPLRSRFAAVRAQPSHGHAHGQVKEPMGWLLIEWPEDAEVPTKYWLSNLPPETSLRDLVYWAKLRWWVEQNYEQLKQEIGLDHFEGRTWPGWHHHVTLCMIAFNFLVLERLRSKKNFWVDPPESAAGAAADALVLPRLLSALPKEATWATESSYLTE